LVFFLQNLAFLTTQLGFLEVLGKLAEGKRKKENFIYVSFDLKRKRANFKILARLAVLLLSCSIST